MSKYLSSKAKQLRKRQLERLGYDEDRIADIIEYEFELGLGKYKGTPLPGKRYEKGGVVTANKLGGSFKGVR